jgi:hypothetical protein
MHDLHTSGSRTQSSGNRSQNQGSQIRHLQRARRNHGNGYRYEQAHQSVLNGRMKARYRNEGSAWILIAEVLFMFRIAAMDVHTLREGSRKDA